MFDFKSRVTKKTLNYFFLNEDKKIYINELARLIEEEAKNVYRILLRLEKSGILVSEFKGKERYFFTNKKNSIYNEYKAVFLKTAGFENLLKKTVKRIDGIKEAYIYGSYPNKSYDANSDIDLLLVGELNLLTSERAIHKIQKNIGREINVVNMTSAEFNRKKKEGNQLIKSIFGHKTIKLL